MGAIWQKFRGLPLWAQVVAGFFLLILLSALASAGDEPAENTTAEESIIDDDSSSSQASDSSFTCEPFSMEMAEEIISNSDTGERKIEGEILETAAVKSTQDYGADDLWFIAINVDGTIVSLAHNSPPGTGVDGPGFYFSLDSVSEQATSFPADPREQVSTSTPGAAAVVDCV